MFLEASVLYLFVSTCMDVSGYLCVVMRILDPKHFRIEHVHWTVLWKFHC